MKIYGVLAILLLVCQLSAMDLEQQSLLHQSENYVQEIKKIIDTANTAVDAITRLKQYAARNELEFQQKIRHIDDLGLLIQPLQAKSNNHFQAVHLLEWSKIVPQEMIDRYKSQFEAELQESKKASYKAFKAICNIARDNKSYYSRKNGRAWMNEQLKAFDQIIMAGADVNQPIEYDGYLPKSLVYLTKDQWINDKKERPIFLLLEDNRSDVLKQLLKSPLINPNIFPFDKKCVPATPLAHAISKIRGYAVRALLADARVNLRNITEDRQSALDIQRSTLREYEQDEIAAFVLVTQGRDPNFLEKNNLKVIKRWIKDEMEKRGESSCCY